MHKSTNTMEETQSKKQISSQRQNEHNGTTPWATETSTALVGSKERVGSKDRKERTCFCGNSKLVSAVG
jgi:hypothetical protein